jgi:hypothetical protein
VLTVEQAHAGVAQCRHQVRFIQLQHGFKGGAYARNIQGSCGCLPPLYLLLLHWRRRASTCRLLLWLLLLLLAAAVGMAGEGVQHVARAAKGASYPNHHVLNSAPVSLACRRLCRQLQQVRKFHCAQVASMQAAAVGTCENSGKRSCLT